MNEKYYLASDIKTAIEYIEQNKIDKAVLILNNVRNDLLDSGISIRR